MKPGIFELRFFLSQLLISLVELVIEESVLLENKIVFQLEVFGSSESYSCPIEIFLDSVAVVFKTVDFPLIEIQVIFGGRLAVDSCGYLLLQLPLNVHNDV